MLFFLLAGNFPWLYIFDGDEAKLKTYVTSMYLATDRLLARITFAQRTQMVSKYKLHFFLLRMDWNGDADITCIFTWLVKKQRK